MVSRPASVTTIAVILLVFGVLGVVGSATSLIRTDTATHDRVAGARLPVLVEYAMSFGTTVVALVSGYFLLQAKNWARYLYVVWTASTLTISLATLPTKLVFIPGWIVFFVVTYFLFRPRANAFFAAGATSAGRQPRPSTRRVASFVCYVLAGFLISNTCMMAFMFSPVAMAKWFVIGIQMLPAAIFLSVGGVLSPERYWAREVGIVLLASAAAGAMMILMMTLMFLDPEFQKDAVEKGNSNIFNDYATGCLWIALMSAFGGLWLLAARRQARAKPIQAPIVGSSHK